VPSAFSSTDCSISPASISTSGTATVTIGTLKAALQTDGNEIRAASSRDSARIQARMLVVLAPVICFLVLLVPMLRAGSTPRGMIAAFAVFASLLVATCVGCGGGSSSSSATSSSVSAGSYTFQVTGQSGTLTHSASIQVTVQ
jgi:hypothetical protein